MISPSSPSAPESPTGRAQRVARTTRDSVSAAWHDMHQFWIARVENVRSHPSPHGRPSGPTDRARSRSRRSGRRHRRCVRPRCERGSRVRRARRHRRPAGTCRHRSVGAGWFEGHDPAQKTCMRCAAIAVPVSGSPGLTRGRRWPVRVASVRRGPAGRVGSDHAGSRWCCRTHLTDRGVDALAWRHRQAKLIVLRLTTNSAASLSTICRPDVGAGRLRHPPGLHPEVG